ncbi:MAG TPA: hypothetical protein VE964_15365 [Myxococcales bacterium]|nr:hypothetical protein [Myxococcales bacterium]
MQKLIAVMAAAVGLVATPVLASENGASSNQPAPLSDFELDQVTAGYAQRFLVFTLPVLPFHPEIDPITVNLTIPPNGTAIVQTNYGGNAVFSASAIGMGNVIIQSALPPGG